MRITICKKNLFGTEVAYIYENGVVRTPGIFSNIVYVIRGNHVCEPGLFGKVIALIKGNAIVETGLFGKTLFTFTDDAVMQGNRIVYTLKTEGMPATTQKETQKSVSNNSIGLSTSSIPSINYEAGIKITKPEFEIPEYNEVKAYSKFFNKYKIVRESRYMTEEQYAKWELMNCGVENPKKLHEELENEGYYRSADAKETLSLYKVGELQDIAKQHGIVVKGKKESIIEQLAGQVTVEDISKIMGENVETISEKALDYLEEHSVDLEYYSLGDDSISLEEYKRKRKTYSRNDMEWQKLTNDVMNDKEGYGRNAYYRMGIFLEREGKNKDALDKYLRVLYLDVNGVAEYVRWAKIGKPKDVLDDFVIIIAPGLVKDIMNLKEYYSVEMVDRIYEHPISCRTCSKSMFTNMLEMIMTDKFDSFEYEKKLTIEFKKNAK